MVRMINEQLHAGNKTILAANKGRHRASHTSIVYVSIHVGRLAPSSSHSLPTIQRQLKTWTGPYSAPCSISASGRQQRILPLVHTGLLYEVGHIALGASSSLYGSDALLYTVAELESILRTGNRHVKNTISRTLPIHLT